MSIQYNKEIFSNDTLILQINFSGIDNDITTTDSLQMSFYAYNKITAEPIFAEKFNFDQIVSLYKHLDQISIIKKPCEFTSSKFIENTDQIQTIIESLNENNLDAFKKVIKFLNRNSEKKEKVQILLESLEEFTIETLAAKLKINTYKQELDNLETLLKLEKDENIVSAIKESPHLENYIAGQPESIFRKEGRRLAPPVLLCLV